MNKKILYLIIIILILSTLIIILVVNRKSQVISNKKNDLNDSSSISDEGDVDFFEIVYDNVENLYDLIDLRSGETVFSVHSEEEAKIELDFYREHPNYFAIPPNSPNLD